ncbi:hypothetical protein ACFQRL_10695 [Microbacterium fluvii]|uniref:Uncharacterized protein n=1 Tax=Microbacterium fluvii TaxID=415215 RepID=A0ABW2HDV8_9MICO|nr:hypothetical protein [Microbacterium fluvii]MCU4673061.1 hypothetical protein [Microbacterium fluvii]
MTGDENLERMLRLADPLKEGAMRGPGPRELALRDRIMAQHPTSPVPAPRRRGLRPLWWSLLAPLAAIVATVLVLATPTGVGDTTATAAKPEPMAFTDEGKTLEDVVTDAERALLRGDGPAEPRREVVTTGWYYDLDGDDQSDPRRLIRAEVSTLRWNEDLSGSVRVVAGKPYWGDDDTTEIPTAARTPGTLVWEIEFAPGEFGTPVVDPPGDSADDIADMLAALGLTDPSSGYAVFVATESALQQWTLTDAQHAQLLRALLATDDVRVLGSGVDRTGRAVVGLSVVQPEGFVEMRMLVSQESGRIVGFEVVALEANPQLPVDTVLSYSLYED